MNGNGNEHLQSMPSRFHNANGEDQVRKEQITLSQALIFGGMALVGVAIILIVFLMLRAIEEVVWLFQD